MDIFAQIVDSLVPYFSAVAQVSGGLVGLVFVALTFNIKTLGLRGSPAMSALAQQTLSDFLVVLVLSLLMLVPHQSGFEIGVALALLGAAGIWRAGRSLLIVRRSEPENGPRRLLLHRSGLSFLGNALILGAALLLLVQAQNASTITQLLFSAPILLILSGCRTAWLLVLHAAD